MEPLYVYFIIYKSHGKIQMLSITKWKKIEYAF